MSDFSIARELGVLTAAFGNLRENDDAVRHDISQMRDRIDGMERGLRDLAGDVKALSAQIGRLEPNVTNLMSSRARISYMVAGMGIICAPIAGVMMMFWHQITEFTVFLWRGSK